MDTGGKPSILDMNFRILELQNRCKETQDPGGPVHGDLGVLTSTTAGSQLCEGVSGGVERKLCKQTDFLLEAPVHKSFQQPHGRRCLSVKSSDQGFQDCI